jgi:hypothetical protein
LDACRKEQERLIVQMKAMVAERERMQAELREKRETEEREGDKGK